MGERNDGGPAFPQTTVEHFGGVPSVSVSGGASLRDVFAWQALAGLLAGCPHDPAVREQMTGELWAAAAYSMADIMLAERERR